MGEIRFTFSPRSLLRGNLPTTLRECGQTPRFFASCPLDIINLATGYDHKKLTEFILGQFSSYWFLVGGLLIISYYILNLATEYDHKKLTEFISGQFSSYWFLVCGLLIKEAALRFLGIILVHRWSCLLMLNKPTHTRISWVLYYKLF